MNEDLGTLTVKMTVTVLSVKKCVVLFTRHCLELEQAKALAAEIKRENPNMEIHAVWTAQVWLG